MSAGDNGWHLDKRVPLALICAIAIQTGAALVWAGSAAQRIAYLEAEALRTDRISERTARLEEKVTSMRAALIRIETKLDQVIERGNRRQDEMGR